MAVARLEQGPPKPESPRSPFLSFQEKVKPKLTIAPTEVIDLAKKRDISPKELIHSLILGRRSGSTLNINRINPEDPYVVLSKEDGIGIFVSSTHQIPEEAIKKASEATYNMHKIIGDGQFIAGSVSEQMEEKPPKYYAFDLEGKMLQKREKSRFDVTPRALPILDRVKNLVQKGVLKDKFNLGNSSYEIKHVEDSEGFAFWALQKIKLQSGSYEQEILVTKDAVSSRVKVQGTRVTEEYNRNNDASIVQAVEFIRFLELHLPKKV